MEYYSAIKRNASESILIKWMNLAPVIQSEVKSERERQISHISAHLWDLKDGTNDPMSTEGSKGDTDVKNSLQDTVGRDRGHY